MDERCRPGVRAKDLLPEAHRRNEVRLTARDRFFVAREGPVDEELFGVPVPANGDDERDVVSGRDGEARHRSAIRDDPHGGRAPRPERQIHGDAGNHYGENEE